MEQTLAPLMIEGLQHCTMLVSAGFVEVVRFLLASSKVDVNAKAHHMVTPLHLISWYGVIPEVPEVSDDGKDVDLVLSTNMDEMIYEEDMKKIAQLLLDAGADVQDQDVDGRLPIARALDHHLLGIVNVLLTRGGDDGSS
ncbi:hypothetical protein F5Y06DRAFT_299869 [Hypoxylon sp. FL0890]|nr:hypothetical protein F5Y06DRAFT_299869 [Hypoxylon sp. FL0890]